MATFTIPKVLQAQQNRKREAVFKETLAAKREAVFKETLAAIYNIHLDALRDNVNYTTEFSDYMMSRLNAVKYSRDTDTSYRPWLHNGAYVQSFVGTSIDVIVDWDGETQGSNTFGDDELVVFLQYQNDNCGKKGTMSANTTGCNGHPNPTENKALYDSLWTP